MAHYLAVATAGASLWSARIANRSLLRVGHLAAAAGYGGSAWLIYEGYPLGSEAACAIATAQALSAVYMLRVTSNSPHAWTFYYSSFASFYYLLDAFKLWRNPRRV